MPALAYAFPKGPREPPGLMSPSDERLPLNSTYALRRDLDLTDVYLEQKVAIDVLLHRPTEYQGEIFY